MATNNNNDKVKQVTYNGTSFGGTFGRLPRFRRSFPSAFLAGERFSALPLFAAAAPPPLACPFPCDVLVPLSLSFSEPDSLSLSLFLSLSLATAVGVVVAAAVVAAVVPRFFFAIGLRPPPFFRFVLACFFFGGVFIACS